jgi:hypothetical protein
VLLTLNLLAGKWHISSEPTFLYLRVSPPKWQSQNGLVESHWCIACDMVRGLLAKAQLPASGSGPSERRWMFKMPASTLKQALTAGNPEAPIWNKSYDK